MKTRRYMTEDSEALFIKTFEDLCDVSHRNAQLFLDTCDIPKSIIQVSLIVSAAALLKSILETYKDSIPEDQFTLTKKQLKDEYDLEYTA